MPKALVDVIIRAKDLTGSAASAFKARWAAVAKVIVGVTAAVAAFVAGLLKVAEHGAKFVNIQGSFARTTDNATAALERLREASGGTISDLDLMARHNQALALGTARSTEEFARMLKVADALGDALGIDGVQAMERFSEVMASGSQRAARALGIEIQAGATRNEILLAAEEVAARISGNMDEGAEAGERFWTSIKNAKDEIAGLVAQSPIVAKFFGVLTTGFEMAAGAVEKFLRFILMVPEKPEFATWAEAWASGGVGGAAAPLGPDELLPLGAATLTGTTLPQGTLREQRRRQDRFDFGGAANVGATSGTMMSRLLGTGSASDPAMMPGIDVAVTGLGNAAFGIENATEITVDALGRMGDAAVNESMRMETAILGALQNVIANIKTKDGLFGSTLFGGILGVGIGLLGSLAGRRDRSAVSVSVAKYESEALAQMEKHSGPKHITTVVEVGGVQVERIERDLHDRAQRDETPRYSRGRLVRT